MISFEEMIEICKEVALEARKEVLEEYGTIKGQCIRVSDMVCDKMDELIGYGDDDVYATTYHGFVKITWRGKEVLTPHTCVVCRHRGRSYFVDATMDQFNGLMETEVGELVHGMFTKVMDIDKEVEMFKMEGLDMWVAEMISYGRH